MGFRFGSVANVRTSTAVAALLVLSACGTKLANEIFSQSVDDVVVSDKWEKANINIGDAQVFTRATLLNDRRRERQFIGELIADSRNQNFEPQLQRDLRTLSITTGQLGVSFDPAARANFRRNEEISELQHEINKRRLNAEIARLARLEDQAADVQQQNPISLENSGLQTPSGSPSADVTALVTDLKSKLTDILKDIGDADGRVASTDAAGSPEDAFRDLQAYRGLLRAYEASSALDDTHDLNGNTFYRLQFRVTVNPDKDKLDRFGVVEVTPSAPSLKGTEIAELYWGWLSHVTRQLNRPRAAGGLSAFNLLPPPKRPFAVVSLNLASVGREMRFAVPPKLKAMFEDAIKGLGDASPLPDAAGQLAAASSSFSAADVQGANTCPFPTITGLDTADVTQNDQLTSAYLKSYPAFTLLLNSLSGLSHSGEFAVPVVTINALSAAHREMYRAAEIYAEARVARISSSRTLEKPKERARKCAALLGYDVVPSVEEFIPKLFSNAVKAKTTIEITNAGDSVETNTGDSVKTNTGGSVKTNTDDSVEKVELTPIRVLDVAPAERAQRISTLSSAAASMQTALAIAAALPSAGVGINAGFSKLKSETGKIEALERVPLVVGYLQADTKVDQQRFGWVLGPPLSPDVRENVLKHRQVIKSHEVQVDLSVPAWWPKIDLIAKTAWSGPLGEKLDEVIQGHKIAVALPRSESDMEALTQFLVTQPDGGLSLASMGPQIYDVSPSVIDKGAGQVSLIVQGSGLWRGEEVFIYGIRQSNVTVLPDMSGLAITLNPATLPKPNPDTNVIPLAVFTRAGKAVFSDIKLLETQVANAGAQLVVAGLPYHINTKAMELRTRSGSFPGGVLPKIAFRPSVEGQNYKYQESAATWNTSRSAVMANVNWLSDAANGGVAMQSGDTIAARYVYSPDASSEPIWSEEVGLVYYADPGDASVKFDTAEIAAGQTAVSISLKLPLRAAEAYPLMFADETKVMATIGDASMSRNGAILSVSLTAPAGGFVKDQEITFEFVNSRAGTGSLPEIEGKLTVK